MATTNTTDAVKAAFKAITQKVHPDKQAEAHKAEAHKLMLIATRYRDEGNLAGLERMLADLNEGKYFIDYAAQIQAFIDEGKSKTEIKGYASFSRWPKFAIALIDELCGSQRAGSANKNDVVKSIITMQRAGVNKATMVKNLMSQFNWAEGTAKTVIAHVDYMVAYANALNG